MRKGSKIGIVIISSLIPIGIIVGFEFDYLHITSIPPENLIYLEITPVKIACYNSYPIYSVPVHGDGTEVYKGKIC